MSIKVYKQEALDGLSDKLLATASIAYISKVQQFIPSPELELKLIAKAGKDQRDLFYMSSILASVGWNANDDVFEREETWKARATPIDKPFNFMHNEADIIGHMTGSAIIDPTGSVIENTEVVNVIPEKFDVLAHSVLYKSWAKKELQERMDKIIADILDDKWFVSMECLFGGFDYAIILPNDEHKVLARNEESAFLTKHLKVYGGTGKYNENRVGRLLRNFAFSGKGLVDNPANKRSVIFTDTSKFSGANASIKILTKGSIMDEVIKAQLDEAKKTIATLTDEKKAYETKAREDADKAVKSQIDALNNTIAVKDEAIKTTEKTLAELNTKIAAYAEEVKTEVEKTKVLTTEITSMKAEAAKAARLAKLATAGVTGEDATKLMDKFASASEEMFDEVVAMKAAAKKGEKSVEQAEEEIKGDKGSKDKKAKADEDITTDDKGEKAVLATDVEKVVADDKGAIVVPVEDKTAELRTSASKWISENVLKTTAKQSK